MTIPQLRQIDFGEIDANVESVRALKSGKIPVFFQAFVKPPLVHYDKFILGEKFIISGQKGTGKTAILRSIERKAAEAGSKTDFVIFRDEILEESDLYGGVITGQLRSEDFRNTRHYLHVIKRIIVFKLIKLLAQAHSQATLEKLEKDDGVIASLISRIRDSELLNLAQLAFETAAGLFSASKAVGEIVSENLEAARLVKSQNESLLKYFIKNSKKFNLSTRIFLDEVHFSFKDESTFRQDTMLVRDCISACIHINEAFMRAGVDSTVYISVRSEFLEHPVIAQAEIQNQVSSYGEPLNWGTVSLDDRNPIWDVVFERVKLFAPQLKKKQFFDAYVGQERVKELLDHTWSKPRDLVRFFTVAQRLFGHLTTLDYSQFRAVLREYSNDAWREMRTSISSFVNEAGVEELEDYLTETHQWFFNKKPYQKSDLAELVKAVCSTGSDTIDQKLVMRLLYILGVVQMETDANGLKVFNSYHRGNLSAKWNWEIYLHPAVARRFS